MGSFRCALSDSASECCTECSKSAAEAWTLECKVSRRMLRVGRLRAAEGCRQGCRFSRLTRGVLSGIPPGCPAWAVESVSSAAPPGLEPESGSRLRRFRWGVTAVPLVGYRAECWGDAFGVCSPAAAWTHSRGPFRGFGGGGARVRRFHVVGAVREGRAVESVSSAAPPGLEPDR